MRLIKLLIFAAAIFAAALLMFVIEPLVAKMLLPSFGGSPSVWNTCVVFFQVMLLLGYCYAHWLSKTLLPLRQVMVHIIVIWLPLLFLPIRSMSVPVQLDHPFIDVLIMVASMVGLCFFAISTTAPLLQKWYSRSGGAGSDDPYFLYAASNAGGLLGLILYPLVLEPSLRIVEQTQLLSYLYIGYAALVTACALALYLHSPKAGVNSAEPESDSVVVSQAVTGLAVTSDWKYRGRIVLYAMIPASLSLGLTNYVTNELSPIPFFWLVPLFIYLLSFVIAFSRLPKVFTRIWRVLTIPMVLAIVVLTTSNFFVNQLFDQPITTGISLHLCAFFLVCCAFHSELAAQRPAPEFLTSYYFLISLGGISGSVFNTFAAPVLFDTFMEYPLVYCLAGILLAGPIAVPAGIKNAFLNRFNSSFHQIKSQSAIISLVSLVVLIVSSLSWFVYRSISESRSSVASDWLQYSAIVILLQVLIPISSVLIIARTRAQLQAGLAIVAIFLLNNSLESFDACVLRKRNFFGSLYVEANRSEGYCKFFHGSTIHGVENIDPELRGVPVSYYYNSEGHIGGLLSALLGPPQTLREYQADRHIVETIEQPDSFYNNREATSDPSVRDPIAVLGLGCGTLAAYAKPGQTITFYEIDPEVIDIASNPLYFTFLFQAKARAVDLKIVKGDGRLGIQKAPYKFYKLILMDAFNSDFIPMHLITKEALQIYLSKVQDDGMVGFNVSNRYYDFKPVLAELSEALKVPAFYKFQYRGAEPDTSVEETHSQWVFFAKSDRMKELLDENGWSPLKVEKRTRLWTDDYGSPLKILISPFS